MSYYKFSPFFEVKRVFEKCYLEHKFTKQIILIPCELYPYFSNPENRLSGITEEIVKDLEGCNVLKSFIKEKVILDRETPYQDISSFFVRPKNTFFGLPFCAIEDIYDSLAIFGVPYRAGNASVNNLNENNSVARNFSQKYNFNLESYFNSKTIKGKKIEFSSGQNVFDLGDIFINEREDLSVSLQKISNFSERLVAKDNRFIAIGGDHSITYPLYNGVKKQFGDLMCLHIDAHNDLFLPTECSFKDIAPSHSSVIGKLLYEGNEVCSIGLRGFVNNDSIAFSNHPKYSCYFSNSDEEFLEQIKKVSSKFSKKKIYLSLDIDVLDPSYFKSVTDPLPNGISFETLHSALIYLHKNIEIVSMDVVEADLHASETIDIHHFLNFITELIDIYHERKN